MCSVFECMKEPKDGSIEIKHGLVTVGHICKDCLTRIDGVKLFLRRRPDGFELDQVDLLEKVF